MRKCRRCFPPKLSVSADSKRPVAINLLPTRTSALRRTAPVSGAAMPARLTAQFRSITGMHPGVAFAPFIFATFSSLK